MQYQVFTFDCASKIGYICIWALRLKCKAFFNCVNITVQLKGMLQVIFVLAACLNPVNLVLRNWRPNLHRSEWV